MPIKYLDNALKRVLPFWFKLGLIDHPITNPWSNLVLIDEYNKHKSIAFEIAVKSMILFKNNNNYLPLDIGSIKIKTIAVIGPCANNSICYSGDYAAVPLYSISPLMALQSNYGNNININYVAGCNDPTCVNHSDWNNVINAVKKSDIVLYVGGISYKQEAEGKDREFIEMPPLQSQLFQTVYNASVSNGNIPIVSVLCYGAPVIDKFLFENSISVLGAGYGGEMIGEAVIGLINGTYIPSGRSTVTWYDSTLQLPNMLDYNMMSKPGRTYKYLNEKPLFPFGFGLSYTQFVYSNLSINNNQIKPCDIVKVNVDLRNNGNYIADESVLVYLSVFNKTYPVDNLRLVNFTRIEGIKMNDKISVALEIKPRWMTVIQSYYFNELIIPGQYQVMIGNNLQYNSNVKTFETALKANFTIVGQATDIKQCQ
eukprot:64499_1